ncbi:MAG: MarR family transcriptional regulator [Alphaproteobacteria bacterium]|nr:MarR family transcriptional regulator [Alphaproteobacteria bacterium]
MEHQDWSKVSQFSEPEHSPGFLLWQVSSLWRRKIEAALYPLGITHIQFVLLANLNWREHFNKSSTQIELARSCKIDVNMASQVLRTLEKKGYLERIREPGNERSKFPKLTKAGKDIVKQAMPVVEKEDHKFFNCLAEELSSFKQQLHKLIRE